MLDKISGVDKYSEVVKISVVDLISVLAKISVQWLQIRRNFSSRHFFMVDEISVVDWFSVVDYFSKQNDRRKFSSRLIFLRHTKWYRRNFRCILFCGWPSYDINFVIFTLNLGMGGTPRTIILSSTTTSIGHSSDFAFPVVP